MSVSIRPWTMEDVDFVLSIRNNPELQKWFRQSADLSREQQEEFMRTAIDPDHQNRYIGYIIEADNKAVGICSLNPFGAGWGVEFGIALDPRYQKKGIAKQAMDQLCVQAFKLGYHYIASDVFLGNPALDWFVKECHFKVAGIQKGKYRKQGKPVDIAVIAKDLMGNSNVSVSEVRETYQADKDNEGRSQN